MDDFMQAAFDEAKTAFDEGNIPVGSVLVKDGKVFGAGRNRHRQTGDPTTHAELEAIRDAAARSPGQFAELCQGATCYTTMLPCAMCSGAIIRFGFARVVVAETATIADSGTRALLERQGITVDLENHQACIELVESYLAIEPELSAALKSPTRPPLAL